MSDRDHHNSDQRKKAEAMADRAARITAAAIGVQQGTIEHMGVHLGEDDSVTKRAMDRLDLLKLEFDDLNEARGTDH